MFTVHRDVVSQSYVYKTIIFNETYKVILQKNVSFWDAGRLLRSKFIEIKMFIEKHGSWTITKLYTWSIYIFHRLENSIFESPCA